ncbi:MAG: sugar transferase [bacterium]
MIKRLVEKFLAAVAVILLSPIFLLAALGIRLSSAGPVFYCAQRMGRNQRIFTMYKFRTMHVQTRPQSAITATYDPRVYPFGALLRKLKIDELPQLLNILKGEMSFVGPRPEDPAIVRKHYSPLQLETLQVLPGLASPGSIYNYTHIEAQLDTAHAERSYLEKQLKLKLALELVYVREASLFYDARIVLRTLLVILAIALGKRRFGDPPEMEKAQLLAQGS